VPACESPVTAFAACIHFAIEAAVESDFIVGLAE
jgi:hypothetical protein